MNKSNTNKSDKKTHNEDHDQHDFNNLESVESVYPPEAIDIIDCVNAKTISLPSTQSMPELKAANDELAYADIYSLDSARRAKHDRSLERRASKSQLTDRRSAARLCADGEQQIDRRAANREANILSIKQSNTNSDQNTD